MSKSNKTTALEEISSKAVCSIKLNFLSPPHQHAADNHTSGRNTLACGFGPYHYLALLRVGALDGDVETHKRFACTGYAGDEANGFTAVCKDNVTPALVGNLFIVSADTDDGNSLSLPDDDINLVLRNCDECGIVRLDE